MANCMSTLTSAPPIQTRRTGKTFNPATGQVRTEIPFASDGPVKRLGNHCLDFIHLVICAFGPFKRARPLGTSRDL
jgi:hypothetical protein